MKTDKGSNNLVVLSEVRQAEAEKEMVNDTTSTQIFSLKLTNELSRLQNRQNSLPIIEVMTHISPTLWKR
jgi:hypothetical protein